MIGARNNTLRIGMIAPEFPPELGGMHTLARGLAEALSAETEVSVFTRAGSPVYPGTYDQEALVTGRLHRDAKLLARKSVDVWLGMNAGLMPLLSLLPTPRFIYVHGKDFLTPWISYGPSWLEAFRRPHIPALRKALRRGTLRRHRSAPLHYFTNSRQTAALAVRCLGITAAQVSVCPPGVEDHFFETRGPSRSDKLRLITVARLSRFTRRKNIDGVMRAVALLRGSLPVEYVVVGDGDDRPYLEHTARELGIADLVTFRGALATPDLIDCYRNADLFVMAAKATPLDFEGFGIVYLEACATGLPILLSAAGGATDAVEDGRNGILIHESSPEAIADGIRRFAAQRDSFHEDVIRACAEQYRWPRAAATILSAIRTKLP